ncbi:hypothetical protein [Kitasatospora sp. NPDC002965]|uniref:hypothetical protein n=1 Tax=Kitasatospora sp. NPDC002965 TaxID=3154775 RepID=UPI0033B9B038
MDELLTIDPDSVGRFLRRWYGTVEGVGDLHLGASPHLPSQLLEWHAMAAQIGSPVTFQDHPVSLRDLAPDSRGMLKFWVESQNGHFWAINLDDDTLQVFSREDGRVEWAGTGETLSHFLLHCTVREAIIGSSSKFTVFVNSSEINEAMDSFERLKFEALASEEPQVKLWCNEDSLVRMAPPPTGYAEPGEQLWMLTFATPSDSSIERYASRFGLEGMTTAEPACSEIPYEPPPF